MELIGTSLPGAGSWVYVHHGYFYKQVTVAAQLNGDSIKVVSNCEDVTGTCIDP